MTASLVPADPTETITVGLRLERSLRQLPLLHEEIIKQNEVASLAELGETNGESDYRGTPFRVVPTATTEVN